MRRLASCVLAVLSIASLGACSVDGTDVETGDGGGTTTTTTTDTTARRELDAELVVQVRTGGGFLPLEYAFATFPEFSLYADGRLIVTGPTTAEFPGRALPNLRTGTIDQAAVEDAVKAATEAGVGTKPDVGELPVADAPTTTFLVRRDGKATTTDVYALGFEDAPGLSAAQRQARRRFAALAEELRALGAAAAEPYEAVAVSVLVRPYADPEPGAPAAEPVPGEADWPLTDLGRGGVEQFGARCLGFTGADAATVLAAAGDARSNTRWKSGGGTWALAFRPELPRVDPCRAG